MIIDKEGSLSSGHSWSECLVFSHPSTLSFHYMIDGMETKRGNMRRGILQGVVNTTRVYKLGRGGKEKKGEKEGVYNAPFSPPLT